MYKRQAQSRVRGGGDGQGLPCQMNAAHATEQPAADGTVGVMVQGFAGVAVCVNADVYKRQLLGLFQYCPHLRRGTGPGHPDHHRGLVMMAGRVWAVMLVTV